MGILLNLRITCHNTGIFTRWVLLFHEHIISFHFLCLLQFLLHLKVFIVEVIYTLAYVYFLIFFFVFWGDFFSWLLSWQVCYWCIEKLLSFMGWFCVLILCWYCLSDARVSWWCLRVFKVSDRSVYEKGQFGFFSYLHLFSFPPLLTALTVYSDGSWVNSPVLFLILEGMASGFLTYNASFDFVKKDLYGVEMYHFNSEFL